MSALSDESSLSTNQGKELGHFQYQSAHRNGMSLVCGTNAHILTLTNRQIDIDRRVNQHRN